MSTYLYQDLLYYLNEIATRGNLFLLALNKLLQSFICTNADLETPAHLFVSAKTRTSYDATGKLLLRGSSNNDDFSINVDRLTAGR